jgi:hypothetical protein
MLTDMNIPLIAYRHRQVSKTDGSLYEKSEKYIKLFIKVIKLHHSLPKRYFAPFLQLK